jgi:hypothetical protein
MTDRKLIRIANAGGYWGDDPYALRRQVRGRLALDYISIDYLAEVTMSILRKQKAKDPALGYARDFVAQIDPLLPEILAKGIKVITNAGGVNPAACAEALAAAARARGLALRIAVVEGDDLAPRIPDLLAQGQPMANMETGQPLAPLADRILAANAYFGAKPVAEALALDPHIVICGRVTDTGITLAPLIHAFGWGPEDYDRRASGSVAGHIIECGAQATGGNFTDWRKVPSFIDIGFPIVECEEDGSFTVTKHPGSGGLVTCQTVREQLLYEMGQPRSYLTPDVVADFSTIDLVQGGPDRVRVSGVQGRPPTDLLKVSIAYADGWKSQGSLILCGPGARPKAEVFAAAFWKRVATELGHPLEHTCTEHVGDDATHRTLTPPHDTQEILLRLSARSHRREDLEVFRKLLPSMILSGPPGVAVTGGAPAISDVVSYWPALVPRALVLASVRLLEERDGALEETRTSGPLPWPPTPGPGVQPLDALDPWTLAAGDGPTVRVPLLRIAHARSGDKGDTVNIGLIGRSGHCYAWLRDNISAALVKDWFRSHCKGRVERHPVPRLWALNFLLEETLGGGGTMTLDIDAQGKTLAQALLRCEVVVPKALLSTIARDNQFTPAEGPVQGGRP